MKREEYAERMKDSKYRELTVTNCDSGKDYVFISYRGNSWKTVLTDIVYKLQKEYKLRIYFDKEFASETNFWIEQFIKNMDSSHCKACLCFFDEGYVTSYATLLELMHAMNPRSKLRDSIFPISFPINWSGLDSADQNTGLGVSDPENPAWEEEKRTFEREFELIKKRYSSVEDYYYEGAVLRVCDCKDIMAIIQPKNKRDYVDEEAYYRQFIVDPLKKKCPGVFEEANEPEYQVTIVNNEKKTTFQITEGEFVPKQDAEVRDGLVVKGWFVEGTEKEWDFESNVVTQDITLVAKYEKIISKEGTISLKTFLKGYNNTNFKKNTYKKFRLIGRGYASRFNTDFQESAFDLVWDFVMKLLSERGKSFIDEVNSAHPGVKNPAFIDSEFFAKRTDQNKYRQVTIDSLNDYYMYRHYSQYDWIGTVLKQRIIEFGLKTDDFCFEFIPGNGSIIRDDDILPPDGGKLNSMDIFEYELWSIPHTAIKMVDMLNDVFDLIAEKYPERIQNIAESDNITAVARVADLDQRTASVSKIKQFSNYKGKEHSVNGDVYCVNAGYNREGCIKQIEKMLIMCEGNSNGFKITKAPEKSSHIGGKSGKKGLSELINNEMRD